MRLMLPVLLAAVGMSCVLSPLSCPAQQPETNPPVTCDRPHLEIDKPHSACPDAECWSDCTDAGYENTCTQAVSACVIYARCCFCCLFSGEEIYQDLVNSTGNVGQFPEQQVQSMQEWIFANCSACTVGMQIQIAHKGYAGQEPVDSQNVDFEWARAQLLHHVQNVTIWVVGESQLPLPAAPTNRDNLSQQLIFRGLFGNQAIVSDPDCDIQGSNEILYLVGSDEQGEFMQDYFGTGVHGYLHGVSIVSSKYCCSHGCPLLTDLGKVALVIMILAGTIWVMLRRRGGAQTA